MSSDSIFQRAKPQNSLPSREQVIVGLREKEQQLLTKIAELQKINDEKDSDLNRLSKTVQERDDLISELNGKLNNKTLSEQNHLSDRILALERINTSINNDIEKRNEEIRRNNKNMKKLLLLISPEFVTEMECAKKEFLVHLNGFSRKESQMRNIVKEYLNAQECEGVEYNINKCLDGDNDNMKDKDPDFEKTPRGKKKTKIEIRD